MKNEEIKISKKFKAKRKELKLSQEEVAKSIGVDQKTISHWENGINEPQLKRLRIFCHNYNIPISFFTDKSFIQNSAEVYMFNYYDSFENLVSGKFNIINISKLFFDTQIANSSFIVKMQGRSMIGKYDDGDLLIVSPYNNEVLSEKNPYIFKYADNIYVRYISNNINSVMLLAEIKDVPPVELNKKELENITFLGNIIGKISVKMH